MVYKTLITKLTLFVTFVSYTSGSLYYPQYPTVHCNNTVSMTYPIEKALYNKPCKSKISNKVPVYDLCYWNKVEYEDFVPNSEESVCNLHGSVGNYIAENNLVWKSIIHNGCLYFNVKRNPGTTSTLNKINLNGISKEKKCPLAIPYPTPEINQLASPECTDAPYYLTNVQDFDIDKCGFLYALDVGSYCNNTIYDPVFVQEPQICIYNTAITNALPFIKCVKIPEKYYDANDILGFTTILVNAKAGCDKAYVYIFNTRSGLLLVYSKETDKFWGLNSMTFRPEPFYSRFKHLLQNYITEEHVVVDGISATLTDTGITYTTRAGFCLYHISYQVINDPQSEFLQELNYNIVTLGCDIEKGRFGGLVNIDNQYFGIQELNHALVCFTPNPKVTADSIYYPVQDREKYTFLTDLQLYSDNAGCQRVYFVSNNLISIKFYGLDETKRNIKFYYIDLKEALRIYPECKAHKKYVSTKNVKPYVPSCYAKERYYLPPNSYNPYYQPYGPCGPHVPPNAPPPFTTPKPITTAKKSYYGYGY